MEKLKFCFLATMKMEDDLFETKGRVIVDEGGPTKYGVSLRGCRDIIPDKDGDGDIDADDVKLLTLEDALKIFRQRYWKAVNGDLLPAPIALLAADWAYNGGPAVRKLQELLGVAADGKVGPKTAAEAARCMIPGPEIFIDRYAGARLAWMKTLPNWPKNAEGWTNRVKKAKAWALRAVDEVS